MNIKRFFKITSSIVFTFCLLLILIGIGVYLVNPGFFSNNFFLNKVLPLKIDTPSNVLLLGVDKVSMSTDVIVVVHVDPKNKKISMLSLPRDTKVKYEDRTCKLNSIFVRKRSDAEGDQQAKDTAGLNKVKEVISDIIGQKIDYVAKANPEGFRNIIDILDGVEVDIPRDMNYDDREQDLHIHLKKGLQLLDGNKAEQFVRYRHGYANGDLGRINAQQIFFKAFVEQKLKPQYVLKADKILHQIFTNVKTDMNITEAIRYAMYAKELKSEDINFISLPGEPRTISGASYFVYDSEETKKLIDEKFNLIQTDVNQDTSNKDGSKESNTNKDSLNKGAN